MRTSELNICENWTVQTAGKTRAHAFWRRWFSVWTGVTGALVLAATLGGCADADEAILEAKHAPGAVAGTFTYVNIDEPARVDPPYVKDLYEGIVSGWLFEGLVRFDSGTSVVPAVAERWTVSPDGRTYTFWLRKNAMFSNGHPVNAEDVVYSFERVLRPETKSDRRWVLDRIAGAAEVMAGTTTSLRGLRTPDTGTVIIELDAPHAPFLAMLAMPAAAIIPKGSGSGGAFAPPRNPHNTNDMTSTVGVSNSPITAGPYGSGPWVMTAWRGGQRLNFERNPHYWGPKPQFDQLVYLVQTEANVRRQTFDGGMTDIYQVGFAEYSRWKNSPELSARMQPVQELRTDYLGFGNLRPQTWDPRVRQAITMAVNREAIFKNLQKSRGVLAQNPVPPGLHTRGDGSAFAWPTTPHAYAPEKARALLAECTTQPLKLELWYRDEALNAEIVRAVTADLKAVGVEVVPMPRDQLSLRAAIWGGRPDMFLGSWTLDYPDIENAVVPTFHSRNMPTRGNGSHFRDAETDRLLEAAQAEADVERRLEKFAVAVARINDQCPWIPLFHRRVDWVVSPRIRGFKPATMYNADRFDTVTYEGGPAN